MRGRPSCLLQSAGGEANRILLASVLSSMRIICPNRVSRRDWIIAVIWVASLASVHHHMSTIHANTCIQTTMPLRNHCRDGGVHGAAASTPSADVLSTFNVLSTHIMDLQAADPLLKHTPDAVVHRIQIWRIRWPHLWRDKHWRLSLCSMVTVLKNVVFPENRADIQQKHI